MSYELDFSKKIKCPCGEGIIIYETESNDWGQIREKGPYIKCLKCEKDYKIETEFLSPKPKHDYKLYYLVNNKTGEKIKIDI